jgi:hypothetical protein
LQHETTFQEFKRTLLKNQEVHITRNSFFDVRSLLASGTHIAHVSWPSYGNSTCTMNGYVSLTLLFWNGAGGEASGREQGAGEGVRAQGLDWA